MYFNHLPYTSMLPGDPNNTNVMKRHDNDMSYKLLHSYESLVYKFNFTCRSHSI